MKKQGYFLHKAISCFLLVFTSWFTQAQNTTTVKAIADRHDILIGEQINLTLEAEIPESQPIRFFSIDSIGHFEILKKGTIDTVNTTNGSLLKQHFLLTSFDSGRWVIPAYALSSAPIVQTDSIVINVGLLSLDSTKDYNDIRDIIEVEPGKKKDLTWYYIGGGLLFLFVLLYFLLRKKKKAEDSVITEKADPYKEATEQLKLLQQETFTGEENIKKYYTVLITVFRTYIKKRTGIHSLQQTTDDLVRQLQKTGISKPLYEELSQALQLSDLVKFARYTPFGTDNNHVFKTISSAIDEIEKLNNSQMAAKE